MGNPVPWIGLAALAAMFFLSWLDARGVLDEPRTIRRRPQHMVCADCGAPWTTHHQCADWLEAAEREPIVPLQPIKQDPPTRVHVKLIRTNQSILPLGRLPQPSDSRSSSIEK